MEKKQAFVWLPFKPTLKGHPQTRHTPSLSTKTALLSMLAMEPFPKCPGAHFSLVTRLLLRSIAEERERERERDRKREKKRERDIYIYICVHVYIYIIYIEPHCVFLGVERVSFVP